MNWDMVGEIKWYHENGNVFEVEIVECREDEEGITVSLKPTGVVRNIPMFKDIVEKKKEFKVWMAHNAGPYAGWFLTDM